MSLVPLFDQREEHHQSFQSPATMASSSSLTGKKVGAAPLSRDQLIDFIQSSISNKKQQEDQDQEMELFYVLDLGAVNSLVESWARHLPMVRPFYAVKCNPSPGLLKQLAALGTGFDRASRAEIRTVLALGVSPDRIVFANTCKPESHLKYAAEVGVNLTTFDSINELEKIRKWHPKSSLLIRIKVPESSGASTFQFGSKFGALPEEIIPLLEAARANQLEVVGVSFHIGSRAAIDAHAFEDAIAAAKTTFEAALQLGLPKLHVLNIGGGYASGPTFPDVASAMRASLKKYFPDEPDDHHGLTIMAEPGRFFANTPFTLITTIIGKRVRGEIKEYWINDGIWGSLNFLKCEHDHDDVIFTPLANHGGGGCGCSNKNPTFKGIKTYDSTVYGPTCDPIDTVLKGHQLPELEVNDRLVFHNMGAYTTSRGNDFNGFKTSAIATYFTYSSPKSDK